MLKLNYDEKLSAGAIMAGGTLGILIPPSIMLVLFASYSSVSVGKLFTAAIIPGLLLSGLYILYILIICKIHPEKGPVLTKKELAKYSKKQLFKDALINLVPAALLIIGVLGSIFAGIATPTEAAGLGAFVSFVMVLIYHRFIWENFKKSLTDTAKGTSMILMLIIGANFFTAIFLRLGGGEVVENFLMMAGGGNEWIIFFFMMGIIFILGMFIDWIGIAMICLPIFVPIATKMGFDPLWFIMMIAIVLQTSFLTPPFGYAIFYIKPIIPSDRMSLIDIYKSTVPFIALQLIGFLICIVYPNIITWLPNMLIK
jgi:tripartite ATP-independent transporter DctM subunit